MSKLENIEQPTFNVQRPMNCRRTPLSMLDVECWMLNVFPFTNGGRP